MSSEPILWQIYIIVHYIDFFFMDHYLIYNTEVFKSFIILIVIWIFWRDPPRPACH